MIMHLPRPLLFLLPALLLFMPPSARAASLCRLPDGTVLQAGHKDGAPLLTQWSAGQWQPVELPAGLAPAKGRFNSICTDPQGNLYLVYEDDADPDKKGCGLLTRVGGAWSQVGTFNKDWSAYEHLAALSPAQVCIHIRNTRSKLYAIAEWNGSAYAEVALPAGAEEVDGLVAHNGALVLLVNGKGASGTYRDGKLAYRRTTDGWEPLGASANGTLDVLLSTGQELYRLGRTAERWTGTAWESAFTFDGNWLDGDRITSACAGAQGELYVVLTDSDHQDHLACATPDGGLRLLHGSREKARFQRGLYDLFCDSDGVLHLTEASDPLRFTDADFDFGDDGYPSRDEKAREMHRLFTALSGQHGAVMEPFGTAYVNYSRTQSEADHKAFEKAYGRAISWHTAAIDSMKALGIAPGRNRLYDAFLASLEAGSDQAYYQWKIAEAVHAQGDIGPPSTKLTEANHRNAAAVAAMQEAIKGYAARNGLAP